jgi:hypothetical protein
LAGVDPLNMLVNRILGINLIKINQRWTLSWIDLRVFQAIASTERLLR